MGIIYVIFKEQDKSIGVYTTCKLNNYSGLSKYYYVLTNISIGKGACINCYIKGIVILYKHRYSKS